ncbi:MAG: acyl carrier protein [Clostridium sp.]|nr:acyl carrier protein [Clostridium sp.]
MFEQVKQVLVDAIHVDEEAINLKANLKDDLNIDSLAAVELALELETEFDIRIEDEELAKLVTVNDVVEILNQKQITVLTYSFGTE